MGYSRQIYREAERRLEIKRIKSEQELDKRRELLFARSKRAEKITYELAHTTVLAARFVLARGNVREEVEKLRKKNIALRTELYGILDKLGLPENYLEEWHDCDKCNDTGYIDGKMCRCMRSLLRSTAYEQLNRSSPLSISDFDSFSLEYYSDKKDGGQSPRDIMARVLSFCKKYADSFSTGSRSLLFQGGPGLGKTHLSLAIAGKAIEKGYGVIYVSAPVIFSQLEKEHFGRNEGTGTQQYLLDCDLLIIDDLGTEFPSKFTVSALYSLINSRTMSSKPTIISTNLTLSELQDTYSFRIVSRIIGMLSRVGFVGNDIRQLKNKKHKGE